MCFQFHAPVALTPAKIRRNSLNVLLYYNTVEPGYNDIAL
jgi:hypothetical protein